jgi:hypothetical protein
MCKLSRQSSSCLLTEISTSSKVVGSRLLLGSRASHNHHIRIIDVSGRTTLLFALLLSIALRLTPYLRLFFLFVRNVQAAESVGQRIDKV